MKRAELQSCEGRGDAWEGLSFIPGGEGSCGQAQRGAWVPLLPQLCPFPSPQ